MKVTPGRIVHYKLSAFDVTEINRHRKDFMAYIKIQNPVPPTALAHDLVPGMPGRTGHVGHIGNEVSEGDVCPAVIVKVFSPAAANLQVLLDGNDTFWATSRGEGTAPGFWQWPEQEKPDLSPVRVRDETELGVMQVQNGIASIDEVREKLDLPPWGLPETSEPVIFTAQGPIPFSMAPELIRAAEEKKEPTLDEKIRKAIDEVRVSFTVRQVAALILELQRRNT